MTILPIKPLSIGLVAQGGRGWIGGGLYIAHIFESLLVWRSAHPGFPLKIFIVCSNSEQLISDFPVYSLADGFISILNPSLATKVSHKLEALFSRLLPNASIPSVQLLSFVKHNLDFIYPFVGSLNPLAGPRSAAWIPDLQHKYLPQYFNLSEILLRDIEFTRIARDSTDIVFSSKDSLMSFKEFFPRSRATLHVLQFCTIPSACLWDQHPDAIRSSYNLPPKFFLCPGQFWIHKNQSLVLQAINKLKKESGDVFVVFTGHTYDYRFPDFFDKFLQDSHLLGVRDSIAILGMIPRTDQLQLMRSSIAVIQPSLFEGWSTVVEDARALGKKIILSDLDVHVEQRHPDSLFFTRSSVGSLSAAMRDTWNSGMPGPEANRENLSRSETSKLVMNLGECFMSIATREA